MNDFGTVIAPDTLRLERTLPGPIERVWAYLTESDKRARWLASGDFELKEGGRTALTFRNSELSGTREATPERYRKYEGASFEGRITRFQPPRLLSYTWNESSGQDSEVTFELTPRGDEVLLVLTHRRLADREAMVNVAGGWHTHLALLEDVLSGREPRAFWATHARAEAEYEKRIAR